MAELQTDTWLALFRTLGLAGQVGGTVAASGPVELALCLDDGQTFKASFISRAHGPIECFLAEVAPQFPFPYQGGLVVEVQRLRNSTLAVQRMLEVWVVRPQQAVHHRRVAEADRNARRANALLLRAQSVPIRMLGGVANAIEASAAMVEVAGGSKRSPAKQASWQDSLLDALTKPKKKRAPSCAESGELRRALKTVRETLPAAEHPQVHGRLRDLDSLDGPALVTRRDEVVELLEASPETPKVARALALLGSQESTPSQAPRTRRKQPSQPGWILRWRKIAAGLRHGATELRLECPLREGVETAARALEDAPPKTRRQQADRVANLSRPLLTFEPTTELELGVQTAGVELLAHAIAAIPGVEPVVVVPGEPVGPLVHSVNGEVGPVRRLLQLGWTDGEDGLCALVEVAD